MFFSPFSLYLKALLITLVVEVSMFIIFISRKPLKITGAFLFNLASHLSLHIFFSFAVASGFSYGYGMWAIGELFVLFFEVSLYYYSKIIQTFYKALFWSFIFNISSILVGWVINGFRIFS